MSRASFVYFVSATLMSGSWRTYLCPWYPCSFAFCTASLSFLVHFVVGVLRWWRSVLVWVVAYRGQVGCLSFPCVEAILCFQCLVVGVSLVVPCFMMSIASFLPS